MTKRTSGLLVLLIAVMTLGVSCQSAQKPATEEVKKEIKFKLGVASYSLRKFDTDKTLAFTKQLGADYIAFKSFHLKLDATDAEIAEAIQKSKAAGVDLYAGGVIYMKTEAEVDQAFEYAKKAEMDMIVGVPLHELLPYVENKVKEYDIKLAIHNHGPGDKLYPSAESAYVLIKDMDPRMGLCIDIGHTKRIGRSPSQDVKDFYDRVLDIHIKDVTKANHDGSTCEIGHGVIDFDQFLNDLVDLGYDGVVALEYEKDGDDPFVGMAESMGYVKGILATIQ
ncbi:sugar phosphate isomerase/epimerase [uncultured Sunxiuqinia sp.]|uniref:sugar phosphate isomerase/epimerase family protein n=1 Tax=uncultured Sunxiuqinia sp. TaxID=1573825 RepID=UPI002611E6B7|nr:sugar phosphate isomerase/epimerase [uncultured Sunxiuqinia sp.]